MALHILMGILPPSLKYLFGKSRTIWIKEIGNTKFPDATSPNLWRRKSFLNHLNQLHSLAGESETHKSWDICPILQGSWTAELGIKWNQNRVQDPGKMNANPSLLSFTQLSFLDKKQIKIDNIKVKFLPSTQMYFPNVPYYSLPLPRLFYIFNSLIEWTACDPISIKWFQHFSLTLQPTGFLYWNGLYTILLNFY